MFPLGDHNPTLRTVVVTYGIIAANVAMWVLVQAMGAEPALSKSVCELGLIPGEFLQRLPNGFQIPFFLEVPAFVMLGYWFLLQLAGNAATSSETGGVAFAAHIGGFVTGLLLTPLLRNSQLVAEHRYASRVS